MISEKNILLSKVRDDIFNYPKEFKLFKNNNFSSACYKLSCFVEHFFIHLLLPENLIKYATDISVMQDQHRGAYRTALKWAFEFCNSAWHTYCFTVFVKLFVYENKCRYCCKTYT